jgi:TonB family protein
MDNTSAKKMINTLDQRIAREFRKPFFRDWDRNFNILLFICLFIEMLVVSIVSHNSGPEYSDREIARLQERFASFVLGEAASEQNDKVASIAQNTAAAAEEETGGEEAGSGEEEKTGKSTKEGGEESGAGEGVTGEPRRPSRTEAAEVRRRDREAISQQVSNRGLLGLLTGTGTAAEGQAVRNLFNDSNSQGGAGNDLDQVLASAGGLKTQGASELGSGAEGTRGGRSGSKANIDDLVGELESANSQSLSRRGDLTIETPEGEEARGTKSVYRSAEAIQEVLYGHVNAIRYCYERELKRDPNLKGKISVRITVAADGHVKNAEIVSSTMNNERVERCILARIQLWKDFKPIDSEEGDMTFRYSYAFGY